ncbi:unnamed protein product [Ceratitis capitata]|uniref:(Mediterranean fruit fly) hypothetical protein n=1 Tax=Ceratitis capitata TaxID=7213 RepID=A0A811URD8_CERCA|nr:unnamed protein product [Ceratitis capitata]
MRIRHSSYILILLMHMREALRYHHPSHYNSSLGNNVSRLRMHIIIFTKTTKRNDAAAALAFGHFNGEKEVNEPYGSNDKHNLGHLPWNPEYIFVDEALKLCDALEVSFRDGSKKIKALLLAPHNVSNADYAYNGAKQVYDVFPVIVPNAERGNLKNNSELLTKFLDEYRQT